MKRWLSTAMLALACGGGGPELSESAQRGRAVYIANCAACHAADPNLDGALGPAVAGSSLELLEARVLHAEYPPGYTPKRTSGQMVALPHLAGDLDALHAYLAEVAR